MFHVGQRIECVGTKSRNGRQSMFIRLGGKYTVRAIYQTPKNRTIVNLVETLGPIGPHGRELGFGAEQFRPIVERKTDISLFTDMLIDESLKVDA